MVELGFKPSVSKVQTPLSHHLTSEQLKRQANNSSRLQKTEPSGGELLLGTASRKRRLEAPDTGGDGPGPRLAVDGERAER